MSTNRNMRVWVIYGCFLLLSCASEPREVAVTTQTTDTINTPVNQTSSSDTDLSFAKSDAPAEKPPMAPPVKRPSGVYRFLSPNEDGRKILHTIAFGAGTFRLQEEYGNKRDSVVVTEGTWAPSAGYIWLYKDQVVRGRYTWKGDTLQYYSPKLKKTFPMNKLEPASVNQVWQTKKREGSVFYAIGNEPFWSVEVNSKDSIVLNMPDWNAPLRVRITAADKAKDSTVYTALSDSLQVIVYPLFCNDGMSDFLYTQKVKLVYKGQTYKGCGEKLRSAY